MVLLVLLATVISFVLSGPDSGLGEGPTRADRFTEPKPIEPLGAIPWLREPPAAVVPALPESVVVPPPPPVVSDPPPAAPASEPPPVEVVELPPPLVVAPEPVVAPPPPAAAAVDTRAEPVGVHLQVGVFRNADNARELYARLLADGFNARLERVEGPDGEGLLRLRVGPYPDDAAARAALPAIVGSVGVEPIVVPQP
jgi:cell division septation protein DedD